jgi:hypothetical protein
MRSVRYRVAKVDEGLAAIESSRLLNSIDLYSIGWRYGML